MLVRQARLFDIKTGFKIILDHLSFLSVIWGQRCSWGFFCLFEEHSIRISKIYFAIIKNFFNTSGLTFIIQFSVREAVPCYLCLNCVHYFLISSFSPLLVVSLQYKFVMKFFFPVSPLLVYNKNSCEYNLQCVEI